MGKFTEKYDKLEEQYSKGKITYNELVDKSNKVADQQEAACSHTSTYQETMDNGTVATWCNNCAGRVL